MSEGNQLMIILLGVAVAFVVTVLARSGGGEITEAKRRVSKSSDAETGIRKKRKRHKAKCEAFL